MTDYREKIRQRMGAVTPRSTRGWIVDGKLGHEMWTDIERSTRLKWGDGPDEWLELTAVLSDGQIALRRTGERPRKIDSPGEDLSYDDPSVWIERRMLTDDRLETGPRVMVSDGALYEVIDPATVLDRAVQTGLSGWARTLTGHRFWFEIQQFSQGGAAQVSPLRIPLPDRMIDVARQEAQTIGAEVPRIKSAIVDDRFSDEPTPPGGLNDVHIRKEGLSSAADVLEVWRLGIDLAERGSR